MSKYICHGDIGTYYSQSTIDVTLIFYLPLLKNREIRMSKEIPGRNAPCLRTHLIAAWNEKKKSEWMKRPAVSTKKKETGAIFHKILTLYVCKGKLPLRAMLV